MNSTSFMAYLKRCLVPTLKRGDIVMMDSLPVHKAAGVREVIEAAGAKLRYLPKYSPDLNPIEMAFSKLKAHLRKAAERTIPHLSRRIGFLVAAFIVRKCAPIRVRRCKATHPPTEVHAGAHSISIFFAF